MGLERRHGAALAALDLMFGLFGQAALGLPYQPRFTVSILNYWMAALTFLSIPVVALWIARALPPRWERRLDLATVIFLLFPCIGVGTGIVLAAPALGGSDSSALLIEEVPAGRSIWRLYHTNCAIGCNPALTLQQEWPLAAGIKLVAPRWAAHDADLVHLELDASAVRVVHLGEVLGTVPR